MGVAHAVTIVLLAFALYSRAIASEALRPFTINEIRTLLSEKETRTPAQKKMDSHLIYFAKQKRHEAITSAVKTLRTDVQSDAESQVLLDIKATVSENLLELVAHLGGTVVNHFCQV